MARTISIVGAGRVGKTLGKRLRQLGWRIGAVVTRSAATSRAAVQAIGAGLARSGITIDAASADVILLTTPDDKLAGVARTLAEVSGKDWRGKIVLHTSGTLDRSVLAPLARLGAATGSLHPMQTFGGGVTPKLSGVIFAVEGDLKARRAAQGIARSLGGVPVVIEGRDKPVYHAAGVLVCGSGFPLIESAVQMLVRIGFTRRRAMQTLLLLTRQMLDNVERLGPRAAWTGPLSRGDYDVIATHAGALRRHPSEVQEAYAALAHLAARVLAKRPASATKRLKRALKSLKF
ncbi:MAG TPA: DUF2520 domain-containing protein [Candidatus Acidoferrales bacterium]|nr:DUF2520 domain-containing protein [Candidatus Acidoferrales bacterium]